MLPSSLPASPSKGSNAALRRLAAGVSPSTSQRAPAVVPSGDAALGYSTWASPICQPGPVVPALRSTAAGGFWRGGAEAAGSASRRAGAATVLAATFKSFMTTALVLPASAAIESVALRCRSDAPDESGCAVSAAGGGSQRRTPISRSMARWRLSRARLIRQPSRQVLWSLRCQRLRAARRRSCVIAHQTAQDHHSARLITTASSRSPPAAG